MTFGADAIFEIMAPTARAPATPASASGDDQSSFDDHLSEATSDLGDANTRAEQQRPRPGPETESETDTPPAEPQQSVAAPQQAQQAPAAALLQIYASLSGQAATEQLTAQTQAAPPAPIAADAPVQPAPTTPIQPAAKLAAPKTASAAAGDAPPTASAENTIAPAADGVAADTPVAPAAAQSTPTQDAAAPQTAAVIPAPAPQVATLAVPVVMPVAPAVQTTKSGDKTDQTIDREKPVAAKGAPVAEGKSPAPAPRTESAAQPPIQPQTAAKSNAGGPKSAALDTGAAPAPAPAPAQPSAQSAPLAPAAAPVTEIAATEGAMRAMPAAEQIGREIIRRFNGGSTRFELRLDPAELGRVDVRLEVSRDHKVSAVIAADNPQALAELSRHARELEQALNSAGLDLAEDGLSFDLSDHRGAEARGEETKTSGGSTTEIAPEPIVTARPLGLERWRGVRVDVMA